MCNLCSYFTPYISDDRAKEPSESREICQPFLSRENACHVWRLARETSQWQQVMSPEQTAFALSQVTAVHVLPPLLPLSSGTDLLDYNVCLRDQMDGTLVDELAVMLKLSWRDAGWEQVSTTTFLCVIGAGVAACIDTTPGEEQLYLRYASDLEHELYLAGRTLDLPRSRLFLQSTLYERFDILLTQVRSHIWNRLTD